MNFADIYTTDSHTQRRPTNASVKEVSHAISPLKYDYMITQNSQHSTSPLRISHPRIQPFSSLALISKQENNDYKKLSLQSPASVFINCLPPKAPQSNNSPIKLGRQHSKTQNSETIEDPQLSQEDRFKTQQEKENLREFKQIKFNKHRHSEQDFKTQQNRMSVRDENIQSSQHTTKNNTDLQSRYDKLKEEYDLQHRFLMEKEQQCSELSFKCQQYQRDQQQSGDTSDIIKQLREKLIESEEKLQEHSVVQFQIQSLKQQKAEVEMKLNRALAENQSLKNELIQQQQALQNYRNQVTQVKELELKVEVCQNDQDGFIKSLESKDAEIQYLKNRLNTSQEKQLRQENLKLQNELTFLKNEFNNLQQSVHQNSDIIKENHQLKAEIENLEFSKKSLLEQQQNILDQYKRLSTINETLKQQYQQSQLELSQQKSQYESEKQDYEQQIQEQKYIIDQQDIDLCNAKSENDQNTQKITELTLYYQKQFQELQDSLDNWFRQQIEIEIKKVVEPINEERDFYQEKFNETISKCEQLEEQNKDIIAEYESLSSRYSELKMLFDQIKSISQTKLRN